MSNRSQRKVHQTDRNLRGPRMFCLARRGMALAAASTLVGGLTALASGAATGTAAFASPTPTFPTGSPVTLYANKTTDDAVTLADIEADTPGDCTSPSNTDCSLRTTVDFANHSGVLTKIVLKTTTYLLGDNANSVPAAGPDDYQIYVQDGGGVEFVGNGESNTVITNDGEDESIFSVNNSPVETTGLTITGAGSTAFGDPADGAGIDATSGDLFLTDTSVSGNTATTDGGGIYLDGGSYLTGSALTVNDNTADTEGGGIWSEANDGIALGPDASGNNSSVSDNTADDDGGGIFTDADSGGATLTGVAVNDNDSTGDEGGGIYTESDEPTTITGGSVSGNTADSDGGGVYDDADDASPPSLVVTNATIDTNNSSDGGGIFEDGSGINVTGSTIQDNTSTSEGGGVYLEFDSGNTAKSLFESDSLTGNTAESEGGAAYVDMEEVTDEAYFVADTTDGNSAESGGGFYEDTDGGMVVTDTDPNTDDVVGPSSVSDNTANDGDGGGIYTDAGGTTDGPSCDSSPIYYDGADPYGSGGITPADTYYSIMCVVDTTVDGNTASDGDGGGIYSDSTYFTVKDSDVSDNKVTDEDEGGGIYTGSDAATIEGSTVDGNSINDVSTDEGGGIYNDDAYEVISNSEVAGNKIVDSGTEDADGAGLYLDDNTLVLNDTISGNEISAPNDDDTEGAGLFIGDWDWLQNDTVANNTGAYEGGGIFDDVDDTDLPYGTLLNLTIANNAATSTFISSNLGTATSTDGGGGIFFDETTDFTLLTGTIFDPDTANGSTNECGYDSSTDEFTDGGYNIDGPGDNSCELNGTGDLPNTNPQLQTLADYGQNGTSLETMPPQTTSPALGAEPGAVCPTTDEVGIARPSPCTIGAIQDTVTSGPAPTVTDVTPANGPTAGGTVVNITGTGFSTSSGGTVFDFGTSAATGVSCSSTTSCVATTPAGTGSVSVSATVGGQTSTTDGTFTYSNISPPASTSTAVTVNPINTTAGSSVTYSATVTSASGTPTGTVTFATGTTTLCTITLSSGTGSCSASNAPVGTDSVTGTYSGDSTHQASVGGATLTVSSGSQTPTITVTVSPSTVSSGQSVTYGVTVSGSGGTPTGTVTFTTGATTLCSLTLASGTGTCTSANAPVGTDTVTGSYSGDSTYTAGTATTTLTVTSGPGSTNTSVSASPNPVTSGNAVTYSATVTGSGTPTGTVAFTIGATSLCTATLSSGTGSCMASNAPVGTDTVTGSYSGDGSHSASSGTTTLVVNTAPPPPSGCSAYTGNEEYVCALYMSLLGRTPDSPGLTAWTNGLNSGTYTRAQVALGLLESPEGYGDVVYNDYLVYLGRAPDSAGASGWTHALEGGATDQQVAAGILASAEFFTDSGGTNSGFVSALYNDVLHRAADSAGQTGWVNALNGGTSRATVALGFLTSAERYNLIVEGWYSQFLGRAADSAGLNGWVSALEHGASQESVIAGIVSSQEYYNDVT